MGKLTHTEKWSRWPSLMKGIFQERLTSLSTMLRQDTPAVSPHPQQTAAAKGRFVSLPGEGERKKKAQHSHPNVTLSEHQPVLTYRRRTHAFI